ncbi:MAG TPA: class I SAM-dependent methyltransferase [Polyangiaceae bacterium]|nr:class I SAM-dependent methyltransferase [Polyangiaceae bacterium]
MSDQRQAPPQSPSPHASGENREQRDYWNGAAGERWVRHQATLDRGLAAFGLAAIERLAPRAGERVIDVGCGAGATLIELSSRVGSAGAVLGVDVSHPLLELARTRTRALPNVGVLEADASEHTFTASYDAIFSRFGVMFFADPRRAFQHLKGALATGGRLAFACWQPLADNPWCAVPLAAALKVSGERPPPADPHAPGPFAFGDRERVRRILLDAGFGHVSIDPFRAAVLMSDEGVDAGVDFSLRVGPVARLYADLDEPTRDAVVREVRQALAPVMTGNTLALDGNVWLVSAR